MGGVQVVIGQELHVAPFGAPRWNGVLGIHPRGRQEFFSHLRPGLQTDVECGPFQGRVY